MNQRSDADAQAPAAARRSRLAAVGKWALGVLLIVAAGVFLWLRRHDLTAAGQRLERPEPLFVALLLLAVLANLFFTSWLYWLLTRPYAQDRPLPAPTMGWLIGAAALFNYLPLRAGLLGRVAYQKRVFGIALTDSTKTVVQATGLSGACALLLVVAALAPGATPYVLAAPVAVGALVGIVLRRPLGRRLAFALALRQVDALIWVGRYLLVFALLGREITLPGAAAVAGVGMLATFVPFTSNGLGLREWAVGLTATILPAGWVAAGAGEATTSIALAADLLNRAGELLVIVPVGLVAVWRLRPTTGTSGG